MFLFFRRKQKPLLGVGEQPVDPLFIALSSKNVLSFPGGASSPPPFIDKRTWYRSILGARHAESPYPLPYPSPHTRETLLPQHEFFSKWTSWALKLYYFSD
ncbi:hypothetical protein CEXT_214641 [Caerostris extrusa]|uniref:Uncharacterized protein n=1 Tax=Caerostris extrusa TaxID=172846 RepID=A0AAV4PFW2_CAEEX|nr:hypothetical protein CEXT_214641 [Caerostris extrusa]